MMTFGDTTPLIFELTSSVTRYSTQGPSKWGLVVQFAAHLKVEPATLGVDNYGHVVDRNHHVIGDITFRRNRTCS